MRPIVSNVERDKCGALYNHGCVMGDTCERVYGHPGDHGPAILDSLPFYADLPGDGPEVARLRRENAALRASVETAAAMVRKADPDLADALLRQLNAETVKGGTKGK